jgi:hypothetical protein
LSSASTPPVLAAVYCSTLLALPAASSALTLKLPFGPETGSRFHLVGAAVLEVVAEVQAAGGQASDGPVSIVTLPVPLMAVVSLPPPACASALALTSATGRAVKA